MPDLRVGTVFGESPGPELRPGKKKEKKLDPETAGLIRGFILVTGVFITLALLLVWLKYFPSTPDLPAIPDIGEYQQLLAADEAKLNNYSWVNQKSGIVRIPIKEAMKIMAERGLPSRQLEDSSAAEGEQSSDESNSAATESGVSGSSGDASDPAPRGESEPTEEESESGDESHTDGQ